MPVRSQFLMIEHARCSNFHFWACSSPLDARFFHTRCNTAFENRHILAKIVHFWSNARAKARPCRIFQCSSMLEPEFWFSSMLEPAQYSNIHFRACSSPLDARLFHTRCNTRENCASQKKEVGRQAKEKWLLKQFPFVKKYYPFLHTYVYVFCQILPKG